MGQWAADIQVSRFTDRKVGLSAYTSITNVVSAFEIELRFKNSTFRVVHLPMHEVSQTLSRKSFDSKVRALRARANFFTTRH